MEKMIKGFVQAERSLQAIAIAAVLFFLGFIGYNTFVSTSTPQSQAPSEVAP